MLLSGALFDTSFTGFRALCVGPKVLFFVLPPAWLSSRSRGLCPIVRRIPSQFTASLGCPDNYALHSRFIKLLIGNVSKIPWTHARTTSYQLRIFGSDEVLGLESGVEPKLKKTVVHEPISNHNFVF